MSMTADKRVVSEAQSDTQTEPEPDSPTLMVDVDMRFAAWHELADMMRAQAEFAWAHMALPAAEISLVLADDDFIADLNAQYRDKKGPTNVLSFPAQDFTAPADAAILGKHGAPLLLGDIVLAYQTMAGEAAAQDKDLAHHARHLVTHGLLHLIGHDHMESAQAQEMEALERSILAAQGLGDPYQPSEATR